MAYFSSADKASLAPAVKAVLKKYNMKGSLSVRHSMTFICTLVSGPLSFVQPNEPRTNGHYSINTYYIESNFSGKTKEFLLELKSAMMVGNYNNSDIQTDYFDVGFYIDIDVGRWDKPYVTV